MRLTPLILLLMLSTILRAGDTPSTAPSGADALVAEIGALPFPAYDETRTSDKAYVEMHDRAVAARSKRLSDLELQLQQRYPDSPAGEPFIIIRWGNLLTLHQQTADQVENEVDHFLKDHPAFPTSIDAKASLAMLKSRLAEHDSGKLLALAKDFADHQPHNERGADLYLAAAEALPRGEREKLLRQIIHDYPNSPGAIHAGGILRQQLQIGQPFDLGFFDVTSGDWIHTRDLRGKVVVVDFWATWCAPCVGDIPHLQKVYARYKDRGLEIISVSLDGPRERTNPNILKEFIITHKITWPQYYQGDGFDSAFSSSWGIHAIPTTFVIDQAGNLYSTDADRQKLDDILTKLLPPVK